LAKYSIFSANQLQFYFKSRIEIELKRMYLNHVTFFMTPRNDHNANTTSQEVTIIIIIIKNYHLLPHVALKNIPVVLERIAVENRSDV